MNAVFRIIELIMAFKFGQTGGLAEKSQELTANVVNHIRHIVTIALIAIAALALFCVGVSMMLEDVLKNIDLHGAFTSTATFYGSLALTLITLSTICYCMREKTWLKVTGIEKEEEKRSQASSSSTSPMETALALVITDFVQERQHQRAHEKTDAET